MIYAEQNKLVERLLMEDMINFLYGNSIFIKSEIKLIAKYWLENMVNIYDNVVPFLLPNGDWDVERIEQKFVLFEQTSYPSREWVRDHKTVIEGADSTMIIVND